MTHLNDEFRTLRIVEGKGVEQFLPGLPNDVVLNEIVPKLPWRAFHILSCVSPCWREAIQSRQVHNARVRAKSMDTLVVINHKHPDSKFFNAVSLYSMRDDSWHRLPTSPFTEKGILESCQCVALDGKLYFLGGEEPIDPYYFDDVYEDSDDGEEVFCEPQDGSELYLLDVVGQRGWKQCARMPEPRCDFACGVLDGKVYVFGGRRVDRGITKECLVYDTKEDEWSSIASMTALLRRPHAVLVGDEFWVHVGELFQSGRGSPEVQYHPSKDRWEDVEPDRCHSSEILFTVKGTLCLMTPVGICVRKPKIKSWRRLHSISLPDDVVIKVVATQAIDGEVLALICSRNAGWALVRSEGFGSKNRAIELKVVAREILLEHDWYSHLMCPIQL